MLMSSCHLAFEHHIKPFSFGSSLICIVNCICLLILYLVLDILFNAQVELGASLLLTPPPFLSSPHNSTIQLNMGFALYWVLPLAHVGWDGSYSISTCSHIMHHIDFTLLVEESHMDTFACLV